MDESKYTDGFIWSVGPVFNSSEKRLAPEFWPSRKKFLRRHPPVRLTKGAINTGEYWLMVYRISATSPTVRAVIDAVSCRLDAYSFSP
jgi:hypothetical protein